jgi:hypothetical protein
MERASDERNIWPPPSPNEPSIFSNGLRPWTLLENNYSQSLTLPAPDALPVFIYGPDAMKRHTMLNILIVKVIKEKMFTLYKGDSLKGQTNHFLLNTIKESKFKLTFSELRIPVYPVE